LRMQILSKEENQKKQKSKKYENLKIWSGMQTE
jgi:hypothetical protein